VEENTDEISMVIHAQFVRTHEYWEKRGKNWIARISGLDRKYGYNREFLETVTVGGEKVFHLEDFHLGCIYEIASVYTRRGTTCVKVKDTFECVKITDTCVVLRCVSRDEGYERLTSDENKEVIAENLIQQLLQVVTKEQAVTLIQHA
jgi:hypothetical protein